MLLCSWLAHHTQQLNWGQSKLRALVYVVHAVALPRHGAHSSLYNVNGNVAKVTYVRLNSIRTKTLRFRSLSQEDLIYCAWVFENPHVKNRIRLLIVEDFESKDLNMNSVGFFAF